MGGPYDVKRVNNGYVTDPSLGIEFTSHCIKKHVVTKINHIFNHDQKLMNLFDKPLD